MILLFIISCVSLPEAKAGAATWAGSGGRVLGCLHISGTIDVYKCDVRDSEGMTHRLECSPECVEVP